MSNTGSTAAERIDFLRRALQSKDPFDRSRALQQVVASSTDPEMVVVAPVLLRALARRTQPEGEIVSTLRALGLRRIAAVVQDHMPELIAAAQEKIEPPDEDELDELPALD